MKRFSANVVFKDSNEYVFYKTSLGEKSGGSYSLIGTAIESSTEPQSLGMACLDINQRVLDIVPSLHHVALLLGVPDFVFIDCDMESFQAWQVQKDDNYYLNLVSSFDDIIRDFNNQAKVN